jgi:flavin reductase (DIM6/NTAB) family NADH-FMN oxidoreductase RutF
MLADCTETAPPVGEQFRAAMRKAPASVAIVTAGRGGDALGVTATAVTSVSLAPPTLLVCVNRALRLNGAIRAAGRFRISYLSGGQEEIARAFGGTVAGAERFRIGDWDLEAPYGAQLRAALASMACRLSDSLESGTHSIFIGCVEAVRLGDGAPLLYCDGCYAGLPQDI